MDAVVGDHNDAPGATRERRLAYITQGSQMVDFLVEQGIKLKCHPYWPDYYSNAPGAVESGRAVFAELFDAGALGEMRHKYQPGSSAEWSATAPGDTGEMILRHDANWRSHCPNGRNGR